MEEELNGIFSPIDVTGVTATATAIPLQRPKFRRELDTANRGTPIDMMSKLNLNTGTPKSSQTGPARFTVASPPTAALPNLPDVAR